MTRHWIERLQIAAKGLVLASIVLVPVTVLPWTSDIFEINKQLVFILSVGSGAACYMLSLLLGRQAIKWPNVLILLPLLMILATAMSAAWSVSPIVSWLGQGGQEYASVLSLIGFVGAFLLIKTLSATERFTGWIFLSLLTAAGVVGVALIPTFLGFSSLSFGNLLGTPHACAVYLLIVSTLACGLWLVNYTPAVVGMWRWLKVTMGVTLTMTVLTLLALDSSLLWGLALVSSGSLLLITFWQADKFKDSLRFAPAILLFVLAAVFIVLPTPLASPFVQEISPNLSTSLGVATGAWNEGSVAFGSGPGTFALVYPKYAPLSINESDFWNFNFDRGNAFLVTQLATNGLVGVLAWVFFVTVIIVLSLRHLAKAEVKSSVVIPTFASWLVLVVAAAVYPYNFTLTYLFWILSAVLVTGLLHGEHVAGLSTSRQRLATVFVSILVFVGVPTALFLTMPEYISQVAFAKAIKLNTEAKTPEQVDDVILLLDKAAVGNPRHDVYYRNLAGAFLRRLSVLTSAEAGDDQYVQSVIASTIAAATKATDIGLNNVLNWDVRGMVYRDLLPIVPDADLPAIEAYEMAIKLAPTNPSYRVEVARVYLSMADAQTPLMQNEDKAVANQAQADKDLALAKAEEHLVTAIALKSNYPLAQYYLALLKERQGDYAEAVRGLEYVKSQVPGDVGVGLRLGLLYLRQGKQDLAQVELQRVVNLAPDYANAHWYLSVAFEQKGDLTSAIAEVEKVLATNPDNVSVKTRLERLKAGETSAQIPDPIGLN
ncbi:MAG: tetratricopeptide repeat protein [Patescibacteria group bacterium]